MRFLIVLLALAALLLAAPALGTSQQRRPPHYALWLCVHGNEHSAWNDPDPPYFGGLQMGWWFMRTYGRHLLETKGTADHWTPLEQMWVAELAFKRERFRVSWFNGQWPPSAGRCGL